MVATNHHSYRYFNFNCFFRKI